MLNQIIKRIFKDKTGNVMVVTAAAAPFLVGFAGLSVDVGYGLFAKSQLRGATEATALAFTENLTAPNNFSVFGSRPDRLKQEIADSIELSSRDLPVNHKQMAVKPEDIELGQWDVENEIFTPYRSGLILNAARVKGELSSDRDNQIETFFGSMFGFSPDVRSEAFAAAPSIPNVHLLDPHASGAYHQSDRSDMDAGDVWVNSDADDAGIFSNVYALGSPAIIFKGRSNVSDTKIHENKFRLPDLLADQREPGRPFLCDHRDLEIDTTQRVVLDPGTYCGGLDIINARRIRFRPGIYKFLDGPLKVDAPIEILGKNILLHFDGPGAALDIRQATLQLSARRRGVFRGFLVFSSRTSTDGIAHQFDRARGQISGTIYAPDNPISFRGSFLDGTCHSLCIVSASLSFSDSTFLNWHQAFKLVAPLDTEPRVAPAALEPYLTPYLIYSS